MEKGKIGYTIIYALTRPLAVLPLGFHRACARFIGWLAGDVLRYRRDVVMANVARSFPDKKYKELKEIAKQSYHHFAKVFCEAIWFGGDKTPGRACSHIVEITNPELPCAIRAEDRSAVVMTAHRGNWELLGGLARFGFSGPIGYAEDELCIIYRQLSSPAWDKFIKVNRLSPVVEKDKFALVESFSSLRYALEHRADPRLYFFITDQYPYKHSGKISVNFMGQQTLTMDGAPALARKMGMPLLYMRMQEKTDGNYEMSFETIADDPKSMSIQEMLDKYYSLLEQDVREQPWNYLWTHKRWK